MIVERLTAFVVDDADVSGAIAQVIERPRAPTAPAGLTAAVETVFITVTIEAQEGWRTLQVAPVFEDHPPGPVGCAPASTPSKSRLVLAPSRTLPALPSRM